MIPEIGGGRPEMIGVAIVASGDDGHEDFVSSLDVAANDREWG